MSSFAQSVKTEISDKNYPDCCQLAILAAFIKVHEDNKKLLNLSKTLTFHSYYYETLLFLEKIWKKQFSGAEIEIKFMQKNVRKQHILQLSINETILKKLHLNEKDVFWLRHEQKDHCLRAFFAGLFLAAGSVNSPENANYHLELQFHNEIFAHLIQKVLKKEFVLQMKLILRRKLFILYLKKSNDISDFLKIIDCPVAVFKFEDQRIARELLNTINRFNNIDISNQQKVLLAASKQIKMIEKIISEHSFIELSNKAQTLANIRLNSQDSSLQELTVIYQKLTGEKISKSGINHLLIEIKKKYQDLI